MLKILYAVQGTGNGHVARARDIIPLLQEYGEVDVLLSGDQSKVDLPVPVSYQSKGFTFIYNSRGGLSYIKTLLKNDLWRIFREIRTFPVQEYDLVINDFEFISAWACKWRKKECIGLSHQAAFLSKSSPRPKRKSRVGEIILKYYAPVSQAIAFHFHRFDSFIFPPVVRREVREAPISNAGHYTVYLPAYADQEIYKWLKLISNRQWEVFSKTCQQPYQKGNVSFKPISNHGFLRSFLSCAGVLTSAGFETPAEAMFLNKKLFVIPIKHQYEQSCNAEALKTLGVPSASALNSRSLQMLQDWVYGEKLHYANFPDITARILEEQIFAPRGLKKRPYIVKEIITA